MNRRFINLLTVACMMSASTVTINADTDSFYGLGTGSSEARFADKLSALLEKRVSTAGKAMDSLYKQLYYVPVWIGQKTPTKFTKQLFKHVEQDRSVADIAEIQNAYTKAKEALKKAYAPDTSIEDKLNAELSVSRLYLTYLNYILYGGIDWKAFDEKKAELSKKYDAQVGWDRYKPPYTPANLLVDAVLSDDFNSLFKNVEPKRFKYRELKRYLLKYISIRDRGGWPKLPKYRRIKPNQKSSVIPLIRKHLELTGDLQACGLDDIDSKSFVYDECLQKAVKRYKIRHGLKGNSTIDKETWRLLNEPVENLVTKIRLNLDRIKWLYRKEAQIRIELNIPAFRLYFYHGKELVNTMRVITGKPDHPTPSFHDTMEYLIVNPYWKIPESIVKQEMLKHLIRDPYYYERRGKHLHASWDEDSPRIDPGSINWSQYRGKKPIPYYFMQVPGTSNALGKIKFLFPNKYSVYIHDTPTKKLFFRNERAFSHGCMRIQKPREMLKTLSLFNDNIDVDELMALLKTKHKKTVVLKNKVAVDITYLTAFVDDYGNLNFRRDVYGYDKYQLKNYKYRTISSNNRANDNLVHSKEKISVNEDKRKTVNKTPAKKRDESKAAVKKSEHIEVTKKPNDKKVVKSTKTDNKKQVIKDVNKSTGNTSKLTGKNNPDTTRQKREMKSADDKYSDNNVSKDIDANNSNLKNDKKQKLMKALEI